MAVDGPAFNQYLTRFADEVYDAALREQNPTAEDARAIQDAAWRAVKGAR